jgi:hypothetical protein
MRESVLLRQVLALLQARRVPHWRNNVGAAWFRGPRGRVRVVRFGVAGLPDVFAVLPPAGRLLGLELKSPQGRQTAAQRAVAVALTAAGALCAVVRDVRELDRLLDEVLPT